MYIERNLEKVLAGRLFGGKVLILYGPRQAGKTTLLKHLLASHGETVRFLDCELLENRELLTRGMNGVDSAGHFRSEGVKVLLSF